ncbi:MAG: glycosyltransferase family 1 protein [Alphaproteobacteria bacterium]|nr:MAG: glycosyltransferase family 1 protein [Alphaproteobacteria bacterium]
MKILYHHRIAAQDGQSVHMHELINAFVALGHEIHMVGPSLQPKNLGEENSTLAFVRRALPGFLLEMLELVYAVRAYFKLRSAAKAFRPDILYERHNLFLPAGRWFQRKTGIPYLLEVNAPLADERGKYGGLVLKRLAKKQERKTWQAADRLFPVTNVLASILVADGAPADRITVLHNGINEAQYTALDGRPIRQRFGLEGRTVLGFTGFVREWHRLDRIIELLAKYDADTSPHMLIVGDGPAVPECRARAETLGIADRVHFAGFVDRHAIPGYLAAMDIALQPAVTEYASPLKLFEYMAAGLATVAPAQANILEVLEDGVDSLLFAPGDFEGAESRIRTLVADAALRERLGAAARRKISARGYTWESNARRITDIAESLLEHTAS